MKRIYHLSKNTETALARLGIEETIVRQGFRRHKTRARRDGHMFKLTYEEWTSWWVSTGQLKNRGLGKDKFCMARIGDRGPYALNNIKCIKNAENRAEQKFSQKTKKILSMKLTGREFSALHKHNLSKVLKGKKNALGHKQTREHIAKRLASRRRNGWWKK